MRVLHLGQAKLLNCSQILSQVADQNYVKFVDSIFIYKIILHNHIYIKDMWVTMDFFHYIEGSFRYSWLFQKAEGIYQVCNWKTVNIRAILSFKAHGGEYDIDESWFGCTDINWKRFFMLKVASVLQLTFTFNVAKNSEHKLSWNYYLVLTRGYRWKD